VLLILTQIYKLHVSQECVESTSGSIFTNSSAMQWHAACPQTSPKYVCQETIHQETNWQNRDQAKRASRFMIMLANEMFSSEPKFSKLFKRTPKDQENGILESGRMCTIKLGAIALQPVSNLQNFFMPSPRKIGAWTMTSWKCVHLQVIISMGCLLGYHPYHQSN